MDERLIILLSKINDNLNVLSEIEKSLNVLAETAQAKQQERIDLLDQANKLEEVFLEFKRDRFGAKRTE